ncbi:DUF3703 domain-containing protein [Alcanivorax sediminis]|uniref:DUF3703 domain-containing protein n=1 Tax=Alcanivorax sediminis TaxID=2663008 RepID=A0A6N7LR49_9GAMM|nr:DUF3703 domain-containing protein [Alcanivorax sediminis]MQX52592.1 DUF3703 domain-containing protein [Alcanivorax sediminis]
MHPRQRRAFQYTMNQARNAYQAEQWSEAFALLEQAHILGQRSTRAHTLSHWWMFKVAWRQRDWHEIRGQWLRLPAALLMSRLWVPEGNTGGANVSPLKPMPIPASLKMHMETR